jgi:hypothetical protein
LFALFAGAGLAINPLGNSRDMDVRGKTLLAYGAFDSLVQRLGKSRSLSASARRR